MASPRTPGHLAESNNTGAKFKDSVSAHRGMSMIGLRHRPLATGTIQVTAGTADPGVNTVTAVVGTEAISVTVDWVTSHTATAQDLAQAINDAALDISAGGLGHNYVATSATDTVTVRQRSSGAITTGALDGTVAGDVTTTDVDFSIDTNTWTEHVSGATMDGDLYYELGFSGDLLFASDIGTAANGDALVPGDIMLVDVRIHVDGQAWAYYTGGLRANAAASALVQGLQVADGAAELIEWLGAQGRLIIKLAADDELLYKARYI